MPSYLYKARDEKSKLVSGVMEASSKEVLADKLAHLGYYVISVKEKKISGALDDILIPLTKIKTDELVLLSVQLASMIGAGISLPNALRVLIEQTENKRLKRVLGSVYEDIRGGATFSEALGKHPDVFSTLFINMIGAGETAGNLEEVLKRLAAFAEHEAELKQKVMTALFYPIVLSIVGTLVIVFVVISVLPAFVKIFTEAHVELPLPTLILFNANLIIRGYWHLMLGTIVGAYIGLKFYRRTPKGKEILDKLLLSLPVWGDLIRKVAIARMSKTLAALVAAGVPMLQSLETLEKTIDNAVIAKVVRHVYGSVSKGESISGPLRDSGEFPPMPVHMIAIGEESGALDTMLNKVGDFYEMATDYSIRRITALLEPIFLIIIGGMVGFIFASILLPIFNMVRTLQH